MAGPCACPAHMDAQVTFLWDRDCILGNLRRRRQPDIVTAPDTSGCRQPGERKLEAKLLKKDLFGEVRLELRGQLPVIVRDARLAPLWARWIARRLLRREARALAVLDGLPGVPDLLRADRACLERSYIEGQPLQRAGVTDPAFYAAAKALLRRIHARDVSHNDLAKEPNVLVAADGSPAIVDFQLAWHSPSRGRLFRTLAREDLRHLLKHKRSYCGGHLSRRECALLDNPSWLSRLWMRAGKPVYLFVTRKMLGWADREGAADRGARQP